VVRTKTEPAFALRRLLADEPLAFVLLFSSMSAFVGPAGQTDYAAGNEVLNALAEDWNRSAAYPVRALAWSVWSEAGLAGAALRTRMDKLGLPGIGTAEGVRCFAEELAHARRADAWALLAPPATLTAALGRAQVALPAAALPEGWPLCVGAGS
jgi:hypothetical protein